MLLAVPDTKLKKKPKPSVRHFQGCGLTLGFCLSQWSPLGGGGGKVRPRLQRSFQHQTDVYTFKQCVCVTLQLGKVIDDLYVAKNNPQGMWLPEDLSHFSGNEVREEGTSHKLIFCPNYVGILKDQMRSRAWEVPF